MDINGILTELDWLFASKQPDKIESFLSDSLEKALTQQDTSSVITIINELIGFYRDISAYDKALLYCEKIIMIMERAGLSGTVHFGTTLLNVANAYRAAGELEKSYEYYQSVKLIYDKYFEEEDLNFAPYYNNLSLLMQERGNHNLACVCLKKALGILSSYPGNEIKTAVTHANLAQSLLKSGETGEALENAGKALEIFEKGKERDFHYCGALASMADIQIALEHYEKAIGYYEEALMEIEINMGRSKAYRRVLYNMKSAYEQIGSQGTLQGLNLAEAYYQKFGSVMIHEKFPEYEGKIAVGLVGEGSECFGFDDLTSMDHDFGPAFCMWLDDEVFDKIGQRLQAEYDALPRFFHGISRIHTIHGQGRTGVMRIKDFYKRITGYEMGPITQIQWLEIEEWSLAAAINGKVFRDDEGVFSSVRNRIKDYYNEDVWKKRLADKLIGMAQTGQYNYQRMMGRKQYVSGRLILNEFAKQTMEAVYLLNKKYAPYYKWLYKGCQNLHILKETVADMGKLLLMKSQDRAWEKGEDDWYARMNINDEAVVLIEDTAASFVKVLNELELTASEDTYLETHGELLLTGLTGKNGAKV